MNRALRDMQGSAIVFALLAVLIVGGLATYTVARTTDNERRTGTKRVAGKADGAVEAGLAAALARIQRVGSANGAAMEGAGSVLDQTTSQRVNGVNDEEGSYTFTVRSGAGANARCAGARQRLLRVVGTYGGQTRRRFICFNIVPRGLRYGLFADGKLSGDAIYAGSGARLYFPPSYRSVQGSHGADIGANGPITFASGSFANNRTPNSGLYDSLYFSDPCPPVATPGCAPVSNNVTDGSGNLIRFGSTASPGPDWGSIHRSAGAGGISDAPAVQHPAGTSLISASSADFPQSGNTDVLFAREIITLATRTRLPDFSQLTDDWRARAQSNASNTGLPGMTSSSAIPPATFQALTDADGDGSGTNSVILRGIVYVDCRDEAQTITISAQRVSVRDGALILDGCNLTVAAGATLNIDRDLSRTNVPVADGSCPARAGADLTDAAGAMLPGCLWNFPSLAVVENSDGAGGTLTSNASGSAFVNVDGVVIATKDMTLTAASAGSDRANWTSTGSVLVGGAFRATSSGTSNAVMRWHPLAQRLYYDVADGRMGTYTVRSDDRLLTDSAPTLAFTSTPPNPDTAVTQTFAWKITGDYDRVDCEIDGAATPCAGLSVTLSNLTRTASHTFRARACVLGQDSKGRQKQFCSAWSSYTFYIPGPPPAISFVSGPTGTVPQTDASFSWTVTNGVTSIQCRLDGAAYAACATSSSHSYAGPLTTGAHQFDVRACNDGGCTTASRTWTVDPAPINTVAPSVTGNPYVELNVSASPGVWTGASGYYYQWQLCNAAGASCANVGSSTTNPTYTVRSADLGGRLRVIATAWSGDFFAGTYRTTSVTSGPSAVVTDPLPTLTQPGLLQWVYSGPNYYTVRWSQPFAWANASTTFSFRIQYSQSGSQGWVSPLRTDHTPTTNEFADYEVFGPNYCPATTYITGVLTATNAYGTRTRYTNNLFCVGNSLGDYGGGGNP